MAEIRRLPSRSVIPHGGTASISWEGNDTEDPSTSSPDEPLSSTLTVNRPIPGAEGVDHAQRSLGPIYMVAGGRAKEPRRLMIGRK